jgi:hypothetical protein
MRLGFRKWKLSVLQSGLTRPEHEDNKTRASFCTSLVETVRYRKVDPSWQTASHKTSQSIQWIGRAATDEVFCLYLPRYLRPEADILTSVRTQVFIVCLMSLRVLKAEVSSKRHVFVFNTKWKLDTKGTIPSCASCITSSISGFKNCETVAAYCFCMKVSKFWGSFRVTGNSRNPFLLSLCLS